MLPRERLDYSPIDRRPPLRFPEGIRLVVWPLIALEEWDLSRPMARMVTSPPQGQPQLPDLPNWSWHEYGMRVGFWRLKKMLERLGISPTITLNAKVCETYPQVIQACIEYIGDWVLDDEPVTLKTAHRPVVALPYYFELHDIVMMALQHHPSDVMYRRALDHFRCLYEEAAERAKIMAIACHPYLSGVPHRIAHVQRAFEEILGHAGVVAWDRSEEHTSELQSREKLV